MEEKHLASLENKDAGCCIENGDVQVVGDFNRKLLPLCAASEVCCFGPPPH